jgi:Spy/CpxP family protein refolding chaperone
MKNNRILTIAVVALLLANIALVIFLLTDKSKNENRPHGNRIEPSEMMVKELGMTEEQKKEYKTLKEEHFKNVRPLFDSVRAAKTAFYAYVKEQEVDDNVLDSLSRKISARQTELDKLTFAHFRRVRKIFTPEQQFKYDAFIQKMMQRGRRSGDSTRKDK